MTRTGVIMGTAAYMSPEQTRGKAVDKRTDIWAFGCVLFEMLTGKPAFPGETLSDTLAAILKTEPDWDLLPDDLHPVGHHAAAAVPRKNPRQRLHDIADARIVLEDVSWSGSILHHWPTATTGLAGSKNAACRCGWVCSARWPSPGWPPSSG